MRGIAALMIVMRHVDTFFAPVTFQESYLAVDLFFVMSGVVICHSYESRLRGGLSPWTFAWMRIVRIYPLYLLGCAIAVLTLVIAGATGALHLVLIIGLAVLILPNAASDAFPLNGPAWSLFFELVVNFFYGFAFRKLTVRVMALIMAASAILIVAVILVNPHRTLDLGFSLRSFPAGAFRIGFSFFAGVVLYRQYRKDAPLITGRRANVAGWAILAAVVALLAAAPHGMAQPWYDGTVVFAVFPALVYFALRFSLSGRTEGVFRVLGVTSYAVYVLHFPTAMAVRAVAGDTMVSLAPWSGVAFVAGLLPLCYLVDQVFDTPVRRALLRLGGRMVPRAAVAVSR